MWNWLGGGGAPTSQETTQEGDTQDKVVGSSDGVTEGTEATPAADAVSPKEGEELDIGIATENVKQAASKLGSYLYGFASVATSTASKLKDTAAGHLDKGILADFQRENDKFKQENETRRIGDGVPPWVGYHEEAAMKRQILALSTDERNFLRSPPSGVEFVFDVEQKMPVAMATLKEDENLEKMRFQLVPKKVKEEAFWRNYFYRVSLVKQSTQLSSMADNDMKLNSSSTESLNKTPAPETTVHVDVETQEEGELTEDQLVGSPSAGASEFVSEEFQGEEGLSEEERLQMMGAAAEEGPQGSSTVEGDVTEDWGELDKELAEEIESFELVNEGSEDNEHWEKEIADLIDMEETS